mgnify:CR=1 FL=1
MKNDVEGTKYCCECDIYHCFEELDPPYVIQALKRLFKDRETLWLCDADGIRRTDRRVLLRLSSCTWYSSRWT